MSLKCPNKNLKEWKDLVVFAGSEDRAYAFYIANNGEIPNVKDLQDKGYEQGKQDKDTFDRFTPLVSKNLQEIERLNKAIARKTSDMKKSSNKPKLSKEIQGLKARIRDLQTANIELKKKKGLDQIEKYAEEDLSRVKKILDNYEAEGVSLNELSSLVKVINMWQSAGDFSNPDHLFLTPEELEEIGDPDNEILNDIISKFAKWKIQADVLSNKYKEIAKDLISNELQEMFKDDVEVELDKALRDVNVMFKNTIDISEIDHQIFKLMSEWSRKANFDAHNDVREDFEEVTKLFDKLKKEGKLNTFIDLLQQQQSNTDKRKTGDLTSRYTQLWHEQEKDIYYRLHNSLENAENIEDPVKRRKAQQTAYQDFRKAIDDISITIDMRKLFFDNPAYQDYMTSVNTEFEGVNVNFTEKDREAYIAELKRVLGEEGYNFYYDQVQKKLEQYKLDEQAQLEYLEDTMGEDPAAIQLSMEEWKLKYNPFWNSHYSAEGHPNKKIGSTWASSSRQYISRIAKRTDNNGKDLGFYDNKFERVMQDSTMKEVYEQIIDIFSEYTQFLPPHETKFWQVNTLPTLEKSILETFTRDGMMSGLTTMWEQLQDATKVGVYTSEVPEDVNDKELQLNFISNNDSVISDYITQKTIEYKNKNKETSPGELRMLRREWRKDIEDILSTQKSWDLEKITKAFMLHTSTFKHKTKIEDSMKICRNFIDDLMEQQSEADEKPASRLARKLNWRSKDLNNIKDMTDHFLNKFYGYSTKRRGGEEVATKEKKKRRYTKEEKKQLETIEKTMEDTVELFKNKEITEEEYIKRVNQLRIQADKLGKVWSWINVGDMVIKYIQVKGIGWNLFSAFSNRGFGQLANIIEAGDGRRFNQKHYWRAYKIMKHSLLKNITFHQYDSNIAQKIKAVMTNLDVLKESKNEIFENKLTNWNKRFKFLSPYNMQSRGEYMNQGEVMIATMLNTKVLVDGKVSNLWDAMNNDGSLPENVTLPSDSQFNTLEELVFNTKSKIDEAVRTLHGNYDYENNPLYAKRTWIGRAASQFRTWAFMGFYDRFGGETYSEITGFTKKGRYNSYAALFKEFGAIQGTIELTKNLARKLIFANTKFDELLGEQFTEVDAANMRKNLQEIILYLTVTGLGLLMRASVMDDDDEGDVDPTFLYLTNFWINQMGRLKTDILFYTNPVEFEKLQRQALPVFNLVQDAGKLLNHGFKLMSGQTTDFYDTGIYAHERKSTRYLKSVIPFINQINKLESISKQIR